MTSRISVSNYLKASSNGMAAEALFSAKLLSGEMSDAIEMVVDEAHISLFLATERQLQTRCSCPDTANPCKPMAVVYYLLAEPFDTDPFLIFTLRGRNREQLIAALRALCPVLTDATEATAALSVEPPLDDDLTSFWKAGGDLRHLEPTIQTPIIHQAVLKRLGDSPLETREKLAEMYDQISRFALALARGEAS